MNSFQSIVAAASHKLARAARKVFTKKTASVLTGFVMLSSFVIGNTSPAFAYSMTQPASNFISTQTATDYNYQGGVSLDSYLASDKLNIASPCATGATSNYLFDLSTTPSYDAGCTTGSMGVLHHWTTNMYFTANQLQICEISNTPVRIKLNGTVVVDDFSTHGLPSGTTAASLISSSPKSPSSAKNASGWSGQSNVNLGGAISNLTANNTYTNGYRVDVYAWSNASAIVGVYFAQEPCNDESSNNSPKGGYFGGTVTSYATVNPGSVTQSVAPMTASLSATTSITSTTATLNGSVTPGTSSGTVSAQFQYSTSSSFTTVTNLLFSATLTSPSANATTTYANATGLTANTTYYVRLAVSKTYGGTTTTVYSSPITFTTNPVGTAPTIASASISGTATQGQVLTASYGTVTGYPTPTITYQWYSNGVAMSGATGSTFTLGVAQVGTTINVVVTATNSSGSASATSSSTASVVYANAAPTIASASVSGSMLVGTTLTAVPGAVTGYPAPTATYQWYANGVAISGATAQTFVLTSSQAGAIITVEITETNGSGTASAVSTGSPAVAYPNAAPAIASASISGTATSGQTLTCTPSGVTGFPTPTVTYQWKAGGVAISGANASTFTLTSAQVGAAITCVAIASNGIGSSASATSSATSTVAQANSAPTIGGASVSGSPVVGQTLTCAPSGVTGYPTPTVTYQWYAGGSAISGATSSTFTLTNTQLGAAINCVATVTNGSGSAAATATATSAVTAPPAAPTAPSAYPIVALAGSNGSITPNGTSYFAAGSTKTFAIAANSGYQIGTILVDGISITVVSSYTFSNIAAQHTIYVTFVAIPKPVTPQPVQSYVTFSGDSSKLSSAALASLKSLADSIQSTSNTVITIQGWVAATSSKANDAALSLARANAVKSALQALGVKGTYVVYGRGISTAANLEAKRADILITF